MNSILILLCCIIGSQAFNTRPIIGVLTVPSEVEQYSQQDYSTLDEAYVKYIESAGAMVVPIPWDSTIEELDFLFSNINGILLTGGDTLIYLNETQSGFEYNKFTDTVSFLLFKAMQANKAGQVFPILGICQGFQVLHYVISNYYPVLQEVYDNLQKERLLNITNSDSFMFRTMPKSVRQYIVRKVGPFEFNHWAVFDSSYVAAPSLNDFFQITAYSNDGENQWYVAAVEAKDFPIYAFQFHPEKHQFEFFGLADHSPELIAMGQHLVNQFVAKSRQNDNTMEINELKQRIIANFNTISLVDELDYGQTSSYIFQRKSITEEVKEKGVLLMRMHYFGDN